jgi:hypothetical protein
MRRGSRETLKNEKFPSESRSNAFACISRQNRSLKLTCNMLSSTKLEKTMELNNRIKAAIGILLRVVFLLACLIIFYDAHAKFHGVLQHQNEETQHE